MTNPNSQTLSRVASNYWSKFTPQQRSAEIRRRMQVAAQRRAAGIPPGISGSKRAQSKPPYKLKQPIVERAPVVTHEASIADRLREASLRAHALGEELAAIVNLISLTSRE